MRVTLADSLNVAQHPELRDAVLAGTFHRVRCLICPNELVLEREVLYLDFARRQFLAVFPVDELPRAEACARIAATTFATTLASHAGTAGIDPSQFLVRVCFGYDELREKLLCDDAGIRDLALEELKCQLLASHLGFRTGQVATVWLMSIDDQVLRFRPAVLGGPAPFVGIEVARALFDDIAARGDAALLASRPGLASGPHVSLLRLVRWAPVTAPGGPELPPPPGTSGSHTPAR